MNKISHNVIQQFGFQVIENAIDIPLIDKFNEKYQEVTSSISEPWTSYLPSRSEYLSDKTIVDLIYPQMLDDYAKSINSKFAVHLVEARIGSSNIPWHRDFHDDAEKSNDKYGGRVPSGDHYYGGIIALEDFGSNCGSFEIAPYTHRLRTDPSIINSKNLVENPSICFGFYEKLVDESMRRIGAKTYHFKAKKGDFIIWHGSAIHRGKQSDLSQEDWVTNKSTYRNSLFFHFSIVSDEELNRVGEALYIKSNLGDNLYLWSTSGSQF